MKGSEGIQEEGMSYDMEAQTDDVEVSSRHDQRFTVGFHVIMAVQLSIYIPRAP
jgi:hypothetical protein